MREQQKIAELEESVPSDMSLVSIRSKKRRWTGAIYEKDTWCEARQDSRGDYYFCIFEQGHLFNLSTRSTGKTDRGTEMKIVSIPLTYAQAKRQVEYFNYCTLEEFSRNKGEKAGPYKKAYEIFYPMSVRFKRAVQGLFKTVTCEHPVQCARDVVSENDIDLPLDQPVLNGR